MKIRNRAGFVGVLCLIAACRQFSPGEQATAPVREPAETAPDTAGGIATLLSPDAFFTKWKATEGGALLDVRTPEEFATGYISGAMNLDYRAPGFGEQIAGLDKTKPYFVYCAAGGRSHHAVEQMLSLGYQQVYELEGGTSAWTKAGMPLERPPVK